MLTQLGRTLEHYLIGDTMSYRVANAGTRFAVLMDNHVVLRTFDTLTEAYEFLQVCREMEWGK